MILTDGEFIAASGVSVLTSDLFVSSIAIAPPFTGLRRFPEGQEFKQWTGDDSKALMKARPCPLHHS